jgi:predicted phage terminase large subunit-like protein
MVIMQRWHPADLVGQILKHQQEEGADQWEVVEFPVILPSGKLLWPEFFSLEELLGKRAIMAPHKWQSQYMQRPIARETTIISPGMWKRWEGREPPPCEIVIQAWDTAHDTKTKNDYSAMVTCGIFMHTDPETGEARPNIILLDAFKKRMQFPELKRKCLEEYNRSQPDSVVIEGRASGKSLVQELRAMGLPVTEFTVGRGTAKMPNDKISRVNSVADIFESGLVWAPETRFAEEVIEEIGSFPSSEHDDYVDCMCMILRRYRDGGFIRLENDFEPEPLQRRRAAYY